MSIETPETFETPKPRSPEASHKYANAFLWVFVAAMALMLTIIVGIQASQGAEREKRIEALQAEQQNTSEQLKAQIEQFEKCRDKTSADDPECAEPVAPKPTAEPTQAPPPDPGEVVSISNVFCDTDGVWVVQLTDGRQQRSGSCIGVPGAAGPSGPPGRNGRTGEPGDTGSPGPAGPTGAPGAPGNNGTDGADGSPGPTGSDGPAGPEGPKGEDGKDGKTPTEDEILALIEEYCQNNACTQGPQGEPGEDGADGKDGEPGPPGPQGEPGPTVTVTAKPADPAATG